MTWWLILLILGVTAAGCLTGLKVSTVLIGRQERGRLDAPEHSVKAEKKEQDSSGELSRTLSRDSTADISKTPRGNLANELEKIIEKNPTYEAIETTKRNSIRDTIKTSPINYVAAVTKTPAGNFSADIPEVLRETSVEAQPLNEIVVTAEDSAPAAKKDQPAIRDSGYDAIAELEYNLEQAGKPLSGTLIVFQTSVWDGRRNEFDSMDPEIKWQITQAYTDMFLANNIVRLSNELGGDTEHMTLSYLELKSKAAERLQQILSKIKIASK